MFAKTNQSYRLFTLTPCQCVYPHAELLSGGGAGGRQQMFQGVVTGEKLTGMWDMEEEVETDVGTPIPIWFPAQAQSHLLTCFLDVRQLLGGGG